MKRKTFNIGEVSFYGRWRIEISENTGEILVTGMDWTTRRIKEQRSFTIKDIGNHELENYLADISTSYWADKMVSWVRKESGYIEVDSLGGWS